ncbi:MAG: 2Fe-2S iron-sulfur cluster-binding protein [Candidatus Manganitrophaceae bacterium]
MGQTFSPQSQPGLVQITLQGKVCRVPEDHLIWIFQDLGLIRFSNKFCWNGDCNNCVVTFKLEPAGKEITERACQTPAQEGMIVTQMPTGFYKKVGKISM